MNRSMIRSGILGALVAVAPLLAADAHTPTIEERLAEKCAENQVKAIQKYQSCMIVSLIRNRAKPIPQEEFAARNMKKCTNPLVATLQSNDEKYQAYCAINASGIANELGAYIDSQVLCFVAYFLDGNTGCGFP